MCNCRWCQEPITDEYMYFVGGDYYCEEHKDLFLDRFDAYDENPECCICGKELDEAFYKVGGDLLCEDCFNEEYREENDYDDL